MLLRLVGVRDDDHRVREGAQLVGDQLGRPVVAGLARARPELERLRDELVHDSRSLLECGGLLTGVRREVLPERIAKQRRVLGLPGRCDRARAWRLAVGDRAQAGGDRRACLAHVGPETFLELAFGAAGPEQGADADGDDAAERHVGAAGERGVEDVGARDDRDEQAGRSAEACADGEADERQQDEQQADDDTGDDVALTEDLDARAAASPDLIATCTVVAETAAGRNTWWNAEATRVGTRSISAGRPGS